MKLKIAAAVLLLLISPVFLPVSDADDVSKTYISSDAEYSYRTYGSGSETSPYRSEITEIVSEKPILFIQSALEGYNLTTITSIGSCKSDTLVIPKTVTSISETAFDSCKNLKRLVFTGNCPECLLPEGIEIISLSTSEGWDGKSEVYEVKNYENQFSYFVLDGNAVIVSHRESSEVNIPAKDGNGNIFVRVNDESFRDCKIKSISFGNVTEIGTRAFYGCTSLDSAVFSSVTTVCDEAFRDCFSLKDADLSSVTAIGFESFRYCRSLEKIIIPDSTELIGDGSFYLCENATEISIGKNITDLPARTFGYCTSLTSINLEGVTSVGANSFNTCRSLTTVTFDDSLISIEDSAFRGCSALTDIQFGGNLRTVGNNAFSDCLLLKELRFSDKLEKIGNNVFFHCSSLSDVRFEGKMPEMTDNPFYGAGDVTVHITEGNRDSWSSYTGNIIVESGNNGDNSSVIVIAVAVIAVIACLTICFIRINSKKKGDRK